jgi:hypothetical protein
MSVSGPLPFPAATGVREGRRGNGRRQGRRPLQNTSGSGGGGRYTKRGAAKKAAGTGSGRRRCRRPSRKAGGRYRRPLHEVGGGRDGGRYINNILRQDTSTKGTCIKHGKMLYTVLCYINNALYYKSRELWMEKSHPAVGLYWWHLVGKHATAT